MKAVVVYESMYGNTHLIAEEIGNGLRADPNADVAVVPVDEASMELLEGVDLVVVGGPTHAHGMSRTSTRKAAADDARKPDRDLVLDPDAEGPGLRDWFEALGQISARPPRSTRASTFRPRSPAARRRESPAGSATTDARRSPLPRASSSPRRITSSATKRCEPASGVRTSRLRWRAPNQRRPRVDRDENLLPRPLLRERARAAVASVGDMRCTRPSSTCQQRPQSPHEKWTSTVSSSTTGSRRSESHAGQRSNG